MSVTSASPPCRYADLRPLVIRPGTPDRRKSQTSVCMVRSTPPIPSPSIVAARAYYLEHTTPIGIDTEAQQRRRSLIEEQLLPRRHSVVSSTGTLATQLENFTLSSDSRRLQTVPEEAGPKLTVENGDVEMRQSIESDEVDVVPKSSFCQVPFQYTHDHLRDWGYAYLGKSATADAFVNAVGLRRPSMAVLQEDVKSDLSSFVTIRARVTPKAKERKPFLIQRQFDIKELRSSIPAPKANGDISSGTRHSIRLRRQSVQPSAAETQRRKSLDIPTEGITSLNHGPVPIRKSPHGLES
jgi:hypothetical protein